MDSLQEITDQFINKIKVEQERIFEFALRNNADPKIKGEITKGKLRFRGIRLVIKNNYFVTDRWLEQRGKIISPIIKINTEFKLPEK